MSETLELMKEQLKVLRSMDKKLGVLHHVERTIEKIDDRGEISLSKIKELVVKNEDLEDKINFMRKTYWKVIFGLISALLLAIGLGITL